MKVYNIGRNSTNDIVLNNAMVSRQHAQLTITDNGQIIIRDLGSSNGTFVNGNKITESLLKVGDIVKCGSVFLDWGQYIHKSPVAPQPVSQQNLSNNDMDLGYSDAPVSAHEGNAFGEVFKYLSVKILNVGDLFAARLDLMPSTLLFLIVPIALTFLAVFFTPVKDFSGIIGVSFFYRLMLGVVLIIFIYELPPIISLSLLSINRETNLEKNLFAGAVICFLQFLVNVLVLLGFGFFAFAKENVLSNTFFIVSTGIILTLVAFALIISLIVTIVIFVYKFFRAVGASASVSIHLTIFAFFLMIFFQITFSILIGYFSLGINQITDAIGRMFN